MLLESTLIILNLILLEVILSIDNATVISIMVKNLPKKQQKKALTYGIIGAYLFRGLALVFASWLIHLHWLKLVGGLYLIYLAFKSIFMKKKSEKTLFAFSFLNPFWSTVIMVEFADIIFSIDNVFSAVAFTSNIWLIYLGVFIGILAIRFSANIMISLLEIAPVLETIAFSVIGVLGIKLTLSVFFPIINNEYVDLAFSIGTLIAFLLGFLFFKRR